MATPYEDSPEFRRLLDGERDADLTRIALEIARDAYPDLDPRPYLDRIEALADRVRQRCPTPGRPRHALGQINWVLFVEERFRGNDGDFYDPRNSYLNEVIERRIGIPISLSTLYRAVAERVGLGMAGVNLPAHFLLRVGRDDEAIFVDPYHEGMLLDRRGCERLVEEVTGRPAVLSPERFAPCSTAEAVARMLRNLKAIYLRDGDFPAALPVQRRLLALLPDEPLERRDFGVICLHAGRAGESIDPLREYLEACPGAEDREAVRSLLKTALREVASWN